MVFEIIGGLIVIYFIIKLIIYLSKVQPEIYKSKSTYSDHSHVPEKAFFSKIYLLAGKPDLIVKNNDGTVPVEIKSGHRPIKPYRNHIMQLASYCLLLENNGNKPKYGLLQYRNGSPFKIDYTTELRKEVVKTIIDMRKSVLGKELIVDEHDKERCSYCNKVTSTNQ